MKRIVGPNPTSRLSHQGAPVSSGTALTVTFFRSSSRDSAFVSAKVGISVLKRVVALEPLNRSATVNVPCTVVPFDVIDATWPAVTCWRKKGLYGTRTRAGACVAREAAQ